MKKHIKKIISILLASTLMILGIFATSVSAISGTCVENHFQTLVDNTNQHVSPNIDGSCGYVAMSSLLAFYDSYWHEDFVPDYLEWNVGSYSSLTDTLANTFSAESEYDAEYYWPYDNEDYFETYENTYLEPYLYSIGVQENCHTFKTSEYGLFNFDVKKILETYLYDTCGFTEQQITVHQSQNYWDYTSVETEIKEIVNSGHPVLYFGAYTNLPGFDLSNIDLLNINIEFGVNELISEFIGGHVMVAYAVADNNGVEDVKLHTGWNLSDSSDRYQWLSETEFSHISSIIWLEIHEEYLPHVCSNNHFDTFTKTNICTCQIYASMHLGHSTHMYRNKQDNEKHWKECLCGDITDVSFHNLTCGYMNSFEHYIYCDGCSYSLDEDHIYEYEFLSSTQHIKSCYCGEASTSSEEHYAFSYSSQNNMRHSIYCACGHYMGTGTHTMISHGRYSTCMLCGVRVDMFTDITIKGIGDDETVGQKE